MGFSVIRSTLPKMLENPFKNYPRRRRRRRRRNIFFQSEGTLVLRFSQHCN